MVVKIFPENFIKEYFLKISHY